MPCKSKLWHLGLLIEVTPVVYASWTKHPVTSCNWLDRDCFILFTGHSSTLLYGLLHLAGY
ncbi:hypothetical protein ACS127_08210 [Amphibacillus sp. Q70]|uniref:hypothetical protein n=1 Tax=Amphibacillus sp. Q70 TaxID=3453416 RepID=UPI003F847A90